MSRFIRKRAAPNILPKKTALNVPSKSDTESSENASDLKVEISKQPNNDNVMNETSNDKDNRKDVTELHDSLENQRSHSTSTTDNLIRSNTPSQRLLSCLSECSENVEVSTQKDKILERLSSLSSEQDSQDISRSKIAINNNNPSTINSQPANCLIEKPDELSCEKHSKDIDSASKDPSLEHLSDSNKSQPLFETSLSVDRKLDNFSLSVMDKLKKISTPVIPKKRPLPNINKVIAKSTDKIVSNESINVKLPSNKNSSSPEVKGVISKSEESTDLDSPENNKNKLNSCVNNDKLVDEINDIANKNLIENEVKPVRAPLGRRAMPVIPRKRPAPNLKLTNSKKDDTVANENELDKSSEEPPLKLAKTSDVNNEVFSVDGSSNKEEVVVGKLQVTFTESDQFKDSQVNPISQGNIDSNYVSQTIVSNSSETTDNNSVKVGTVQSNTIKSNNVNKSIKKRVGPNLARNNVKKSENQISNYVRQNFVKPVDRLEDGLFEIDKADNDESANDNMKLVLSNSTEENKEINATVSVLPSTSKVESKGVLRVYLNCWPSYPLSEVGDSLHSGAQVEDVGKVSIFPNKEHKIAYWDLKRVVDFKNTPKNWVNINFNKLIKEEFKEPNEEVNEESSIEDQINYDESHASENEEYEHETCEPGPQSVEVLSSIHRNENTDSFAEPKVQKEEDSGLKDDVENVLSQDSSKVEASLSNTSPSVVLKSNGIEPTDVSGLIESNDSVIEARDNSDDKINVGLKPEESNLSKIISEVASGNLGIIKTPEKNESSGRRKKSKTPKKIIETPESQKSTLDNSEESKMNENKKPKKRKIKDPTGKKKPKKIKFDKKSKKKERNEKVNVELGNLAAELAPDQTKSSYKFRPKKPLKNVENYEDEDLDKPEDIFSNSEFSDSEYECELENKIDRNKLKVKMNSVIKQKKPRKPKEKKPKKEKEKSEKNITEKVKKSPKMNEKFPDCNKLSVKVTKNKWDQERNCVEPEKLELKDFIFYTPKTEPMSQDSKKETNIVPDEDIIEDEQRDQEENTGPKLIVKDGKIMVDPNSTKIKQTPIIQNKIEKVEKPKDINDPWVLKETMKFYATLWKYGIDYSILEGTFPKKSRESIKRKYNYERKHNGTLLSKTLTKQLDIKAVLREIILIECLDKLSNNRNKEKIKKEPKETKVKKKGKHCLIQRPSKKPRVEPSPVKPIDYDNDSQLSMNSYLSDNEIIISEDVRNLNMEDIITFSTNLVYQDMNIVESVSFHPSAINPVDINVTIRHDTNETTPHSNDETTPHSNDETTPHSNDETTPHSNYSLS